MIMFVDQAIEILNQAVEADRIAMNQLINTRAPCNMTLAQHPTIQVGVAPASNCGKTEDINSLKFEVGLLGILNGLFGVDENDCGFIAAKYENGKLIGFIRR